MPYSLPPAVRRARRRPPRPPVDRARAAPATAADWPRLRRFLVLGSDGPAYRAGERTPPQRHAALVERCLRADGPRLVAEIVAVRERGRHAREAPALFALALAAATGDLETRRAAHDALPAVALTSEELFAFVAFAGEVDGWGRSLRRAVGRWYASRSPEALGREVIACRRLPGEGLTHRDVLRIAYPAGRASAQSSEHAGLLQWIVRGGPAPARPPVVEGFAHVQVADGAQRAAALVREYRLPPQALRAEHLACAEVWSALLDDMPLRALLRNLPAMTEVGLLAPASDAVARVVERLRDGAERAAAGVEPIVLLAALRAYARGQQADGARRRSAVADIVDALEGAFHASLANVEPTARRLHITLDVSPSMRVGDLAGMPGLSPLEVATALALVSAATEARCEIACFAAAVARRRATLPARARRARPAGGLAPLAIAAGQRLSDALAAVSGLRHSDTDLALPMRDALTRGLAVDAFVIYTDTDTLARETHPALALAEYRRRSGIDARLVVVAMAARRLSIADPADPGMLDVVGFDLATPRLIADFVRGEL
jgi:60 kDa SS-A/Ro ribonucleoprotein